MVVTVPSPLLLLHIEGMAVEEAEARARPETILARELEAGARGSAHAVTLSRHARGLAAAAALVVVAEQRRRPCRGDGGGDTFSRPFNCCYSLPHSYYDLS